MEPFQCKVAMVDGVFGRTGREFSGGTIGKPSTPPML